MPTSFAVGYCRLSDRNDKSSSIASQKKRITEYCERYGLELLQIFVDDGKSGWTFDRPGFIDLEAFCKKNNKVSYLIIPHFDRFSRADPIDAMVKERQFRDKLKVKVLQVSEPPDTDTENSTYQILRFMQAFAANEERNRIVDRVTTSIRHRRSEGFYCASAPFGYKYARNEKKQAVLVQDEARALIIKFICEQFLKGYGIEEIRRQAITKGFTVKGKTVIQSVLTSPVYAGLIRVPAYKHYPEKLVKGVHQGIITEEQYWKIQEKFSPRRFTPQKREEAPLRGVLKCPHCSKLLTAAPSQGRHGKYYWYYFCIEHRKGNYSAKKIHDALDLVLDEISVKGEYLEKFKLKVSAIIQDLINGQTKELMRLDLQIRATEKSITDIEEKYLLESVSIQTYKKVIGEKKTYLSELRIKKDLLDFRAHEYLGRLDVLLNNVSNVRTLYHEVNLLSKQLLIKQIFGNKLSYSPDGLRTPYLHPIFSINKNVLNDLPITIEDDDKEKIHQIDAVTPQVLPSNPREFLESLFSIFAA